MVVVQEAQDMRRRVQQVEFSKIVFRNLPVATEEARAEAWRACMAGAKAWAENRLKRAIKMVMVAFIVMVQVCVLLLSSDQAGMLLFVNVCK